MKLNSEATAKLHNFEESRLKRQPSPHLYTLSRSTCVRTARQSQRRRWALLHSGCEPARGVATERPAGRARACRAGEASRAASCAEAAGECWLSLSIQVIAAADQGTARAAVSAAITNGPWWRGHGGARRAWPGRRGHQGIAAGAPWVRHDNIGRRWRPRARVDKARPREAQACGHAFCGMARHGTARHRSAGVAADGWACAV